MTRWMVLVAVVGCGFQREGAPLGPGEPGAPDAPATPDVDAAPIPIDAPPGVPDRDADGKPDSLDNCLDVSNPDQADEDTDRVGNVCDNCPHLANENQADSEPTPDGVGDVCDPQPSAGGNTIALFLPFDAPSEIATWTKAGTNQQYAVSNGALRQTGQSDLAIMWKNDLDVTNAWITSEITMDDIDSGQFRGVAIMTRFVRTTDFGHGAGCGEMRDTMFNGGNSFYNLTRFGNGAFTNLAATGPGANVSAGHTARYTAHYTGGNTYQCTIGTKTYTGDQSLEQGGGTGINLATWNVKASFKYLVVIK
jgi:hypothetical protein